MNTTRQPLKRFVSFSIAGMMASSSVFSGWAGAEPLEDILSRMNEKSFPVFIKAASIMKEAGQNTFVKRDGYQARILRSFCTDVYGPKWDGYVPTGMISGRVVPGQPVQSALKARINWVSSRCEKSALVRGFLSEYWTVTADQAEGFLARVAKLINVRNGQEERMFWEDAQTLRTEAAVHASDAEFVNAVVQDSQSMVNTVFGDLGMTYTRVKEKLSVVAGFSRRFPGGSDPQESLSQMLQDLQREGDEVYAQMMSEDLPLVGPKDKDRK